jgi:hypothetical protein
VIFQPVVIYEAADSGPEISCSRRTAPKMFVSVGSQSNDALSLVQSPLPGFSRFAARHGFGAIMRWLVAEDLVSSEEHRADVLQCNPDGSGFRIFATGLRIASECRSTPLAASFGVLPTSATAWAMICRLTYHRSRKHCRPGLT